MAWPCYWLEETGRVAFGLRRYTWRDAQAGARVWECSAGWHAGFGWRGLTGPARMVEDADGGGRRHYAMAAPVSHGDPAWPGECQRGCGYRFTDEDRWQEWEEPILSGQGGEWVRHVSWPPPPGTQTAGPGAMWDAWWLPAAWKGADGIGLMVRCPDPARPAEPRAHDWIVDGPATSGGRWTRVGDPKDPPSLTVTPSIAAGEPGTPGFYHGFLQAGTLTDHLGG